MIDAQIATTIKKATRDDVIYIANLALQLWNGHTQQELADEFFQLIDRKDATIFLAFTNDNAIGFAQCQLRYDYVEGTDSSPVGYLEGIFVENPFRKQGLGRKLIAACEQWAKDKGCLEFASDCELNNTDSLSFHLHSGFEEANRIICFVKKI